MASSFPVVLLSLLPALAAALIRQKGVQEAALMVSSAAASTPAVPWSEYFTQSFYHASVIPLLLLTGVLAYAARPSTKAAIPSNFGKFQLSYLLVWTFCVAADWLQGPFVYALYAAYGFSKEEIAQLFVAGFASSLVFGCLVGTVADKFGRKKCCIMYCLLYIASCLTKHFNQYSILMVGRITGGIATSMLFSCFECWMVAEHLRKNKFSSGLLDYMFGLMFTVMYCVAIASGLVGQFAADTFKFAPVSEGSVFHMGGYIAPFDLAIVCLCIGMALIIPMWEENYGAEAPEDSIGLLENLRSAGYRLLFDTRTLLLCLVVSCFEGSMYAFVFNWTPALDSATTPPPYGLIFALFMMACMCGASAATLMANACKPATRLTLTIAAGISSFMLASYTGYIRLDLHLQMTFFAFMLFEFCVGVYFPSVGVLKSDIVPEQVRGTMYNLFRVPLNAIVVALLLSNISIQECFRLNAALLTVALVCVLALNGVFGQISRSVPKHTASMSVGQCSA